MFSGVARLHAIWNDVDTESTPAPAASFHTRVGSGIQGNEYQRKNGRRVSTPSDADVRSRHTKPVARTGLLLKTVLCRDSEARHLVGARRLRQGPEFTRIGPCLRLRPEREREQTRLSLS